MLKYVFKKKKKMKCCNEIKNSWFILILCLIVNIIAESISSGFENFSDPYCKKFNHLVVDKNQGWVFIGAVNRFYTLSPDLKMMENLTTGPMYNYKCTKPNCPKVIDNYNKILVLDYNTTRLISCGSCSQGSCDVYEIINSPRKIFSVNNLGITSSPSASTIAFVAPGTSKQLWWGKYSLPALYVGVTHTSNSIHKSKVPAVSTRFLKEDKFYQIIESGTFFTSSTEISFNDEFLEKYIVNYVYGFSSGSQSYFMTTQMNSTQSSPYISKLIRICQKDNHYNSYTEIPISCTDEDEKVYNLVQAAFITKPSSELAKSLGITTQDDVLFGIFSKSKESLSNEPSNESALCVYSLKAINDKFSENILNCYEGKGDHGLEYIYSSKEKCRQKKPVNDSNSCGLTLNTPFGGNLPVQATPVVTFNTLLTAVTAVSKTDFIIVIVGTFTGHLQLIALMNTTAALTLNELDLEERSPINSDLQFDPREEHLYAMAGHKLTKIKIHDVLPSISSFNPKNGPWEGGTNVTIEIKNFHNLFKRDIHFDIKVAGCPCIPYKYHRSLRKIVCITNNGESELLEGPVEVLVNGISIISESNFTFFNVKITDFFPKDGPLFGGTELIIGGEHLGSGSSANVFIGNISCTIFYRNTTILKCITGPSSTLMEVSITVKIDGSSNVFPGSFSYLEDLNRDLYGYNKIPKGIPAGGIAIVIREEDLKLSQKLMLRIYNKYQTYDSTCEIKNSSVAICFSPPISDIDSHSIDAENPIKFNLLLVTGNEDEINYSNTKYVNFLLYPNPDFINFSEADFNGSIVLIIKGQNVDKACQQIDFKVLVGNNTCEVLSLSQYRLICFIRKNEISRFRNGSKFVLPTYQNITVLIGNNISQIVYNENYMPNPEQSHPQSYGTPSVIYPLCIGILFGFVILSPVVIISYIVYRRKYSKSSQALMNVQKNMNNVCVETLALRQWIKQLVIEKNIDLNEELSNVLKLPNITIIYTPVPRAAEETSPDPESYYRLPLDNKWEFSRSKLRLGKQIGEGEFGKVFQGEALGILYENTATAVAVKKLKDTHSDAHMIALVSEMEMMKLIGTHENVLQLLGCCTQNGDLLIITEYALHGNLRDFLRKYLASANNIMPKSLSEKDLLNFGIQIANGMVYLASIKCIHRDLAARNILVSKEYVMKIGDFGLARDIHQTDYYRKKSDGRLPVKWMAPEALCHSLYTTQSDIWSYGILLWEIMTLGSAPYPSFSDVGKLNQALQSGYRMEKPPNCSQMIYDLMRRCWNFLPEDRPSFPEIMQELEEMISASNDMNFETCNLYRRNIHESDV